MAVIIDMDMPKVCWDCSMFKLGTYRKLHHCNALDRDMYFDNGEAKRFRLKDCPLRSADEMVAEIRGLQCYGDGSYPMNKNVYVDGKKVLDIIHKYTKEQD